MIEHDKAIARRALLEHWVSLFRDAVERQEREADAARAASPGKPTQRPPLVIPAPSNEMLELLLGGLQNALNGKNDPFDIATRQGNAPTFTRQERISIVRTLLWWIKLLKRNSNDEMQCQRIAIQDAADLYNLTPEAIKGYLRDADLAGWAKLQGLLSVRKLVREVEKELRRLESGGADPTALPTKNIAVSIVAARRGYPRVPLHKACFVMKNR